MKKRLLTLSLALSAVIGASAGYTSGNFYYNEAARYKVIGENQLTGTDLSGGLTGMGFTHEGAVLFGEKNVVLLPSIEGSVSAASVMVPEILAARVSIFSLLISTVRMAVLPSLFK